MRRRPVDDAQRFSLFPFLAVLLCTMGALLVLLVVISRQAVAEAQEQAAEERAEAARAAQAAADEEPQITPEEAAQARAEWEQRLEALSESRAQTEQRMQQLRQALSDLENHMSRLIERLHATEAAAEELASETSDNRALEEIEREIAATQQAIDDATRELAEARERAAERQGSYAIVPYEGANGTRRMPIYLECLAEAVVIQPYGIRLNEDDFRGDLDQDNPLAVALRAAVGYAARQQVGGDREANAPYPLLIVRPSGIPAFYAARAAMSSWSSEFGYELIDEDWPLEFAAGDPRMGQAMQEAVELSRRRREAMARIGRGPGSGGRGRGGNGRGGQGDSPFSIGGRGGADGDGGSGSRAASGGRGAYAGSGAPAGASGGQAAGRPQYEGNRPGQGTNPTPGEIVNHGGGKDESADRPGGRRTPGSIGSVAGEQAIADTRGKDWALPAASQGATAITRPVALLVAADRIIILENVRATSGKTIMMPGETRDSIDALVSAMWEHMNGWGIAGRGLYWKPVISPRVAPGGELRASELQQLLRGSGMEVEFR